MTLFNGIFHFSLLMPPDASWCLLASWPPGVPDASQMPPRCLPDASQIPPRCCPDAFRMPPKNFVWGVALGSFIFLKMYGTHISSIFKISKSQISKINTFETCFENFPWWYLSNLVYSKTRIRGLEASPNHKIQNFPQMHLIRPKQY